MEDFKYFEDDIEPVKIEDKACYNCAYSGKIDDRCLDCLMSNQFTRWQPQS